MSSGTRKSSPVGSLSDTYSRSVRRNPRTRQKRAPPSRRSGTSRADAGVKGRWHDNRHTLITVLAESGAGDQTIQDIAGHVSRQMLKHYSHIRMDFKQGVGFGTTG
jgi:integrase